MSSFLVTGGASFIGRHLTEALVRANHEVTLVVRNASPGRRSWSQNLGVAMEEIDLSTRDSLKRMPPHEFVVHAAARSIVGQAGGASLVRDNVQASRYVANWAKQSRATALVGLSSMSVFGRPTGGLVNELTVSQNPSRYGISKLLGERALLEVEDSCLVTILRLPGVVGIGAHRIWLSRLLSSVLEDEPITVLNASDQFNNVVHVSDLCSLIAESPQRGSDAAGTFVLGAREPVPVRKVVETVVDVAESGSRIHEGHGGPPAFVIDDSRARRCLGYESLTTLSAISRYVREIVKLRDQ